MMRTTDVTTLAGPCTAILVYLALPDTYLVSGRGEIVLDGSARWTLALAAWMAVWWISEAVPVAVTALLPIVLFPLFGLNSLAGVTTAYAHPLIFLFFGGFLLSISIEKWRLHAWIARRVVARAGGDARRMVGGFMLVAAFLSMWLSNTATAIMMLPIAISTIAAVDAEATPEVGANFARCLLLGVAYAASIGGTATLIGSPPNLFVATFIHEQFGIQLDFRQWMVAAAPVTVLMLPLTWLALTRFIAPVDGHSTALNAEPGSLQRWRELGPAARRVGVVFLFAVIGWLSRASLAGLEIAGHTPFANLSDTGIAMCAGLALFVIPAGAGNGRLLDWHDVEKLPFGTLILFGGGLALAATVSATGADGFIGAQLAALVGVPHWLAITVIVTVVVFLTEMTSNTATTTTLAPILAATAIALGLQPLAVVIVTALAASSAFMMPVATPPNAIVFASGRISVMAMARAGLLVNLIAIAVITAVALLWLPQVVAHGVLR